MKNDEEGIKTEVFTGSGNTREDSTEIAEIRFETWKRQLKRVHVKIDELDKDYEYEEKNSVNIRCTLTVTYKEIKEQDIKPV